MGTWVASRRTCVEANDGRNRIEAGADLGAVLAFILPLAEGPT